MQRQGPQDHAWNSLSLQERGGRRQWVSIWDLFLALREKEGGTEAGTLRYHNLDPSLVAGEREDGPEVEAMRHHSLYLTAVSGQREKEAKARDSRCRNLDLTLVPGERNNKNSAGLLLWPRAFLPEEAAYRTADPSTQGRDLWAKIKYKRM